MTSGSSTLDLVVWTIYVGIMIGVVFSVINRVHSHRIISRLVSTQSNDRDSSKTLKELGLEKNILIRSMLKPSSPLMRYIKISNKEDISSVSGSKLKKFWYRAVAGDKVPETYPVSKASMYLPEDDRIGAEIRFSGEKHPVFIIIVAAVLMFATACLALYLIPQLTVAFTNTL